MFSVCRWLRQTRYVGQVQLQTGQSKCVECLAGSYRGTTDNANEACVPCAAGYYQEDAGQGQCLPCIPSSFNPEEDVHKWVKRHRYFLLLPIAKFCMGALSYLGIVILNSWNDLAATPWAQIMAFAIGVGGFANVNGNGSYVDQRNDQVMNLLRSRGLSHGYGGRKRNKRLQATLKVPLAESVKQLVSLYREARISGCSLLSC